MRQWVEARRRQQSTKLANDHASQSGKARSLGRPVPHGFVPPQATSELARLRKERQQLKRYVRMACTSSVRLCACPSISLPTYPLCNTVCVPTLLFTMLLPYQGAREGVPCEENRICLLPHARYSHIQAKEAKNVSPTHTLAHARIIRGGETQATEKGLFFCKAPVNCGASPEK